MRRSLVLLALLFVGCGGDSPTSPSKSQPTVTRIMRLEGNLAFGQIPVGQSSEASLRIFNDGTAPLTVTGMTGPGGIASSWTNGVVAPGASQTATIRFSPTEARSYNGSLTVQSDKTGGSDTIAVSGAGQRERFVKSGSGDTVFDMPTDVARIHIVGTYNGNSSNFIVKIGGRLIVNELLGTAWQMTRYDGTLLTGGGGVVAITNSSGVAWTFEEVR